MLMETEVVLFFRDQLRDARAAVLRDAEAYDAVVLVMERLGRYLHGKPETGLGRFKEALTKIAAQSPLAAAIPAAHAEYHLPFGTLFSLLVEARNAAVHEGALARHLAANALEISLVIEDALMVSARTVGDYMVRGPSVALPWQPLSMIRQVMLSNSFSYLPARVPNLGDGGWRVVSDIELAKFFRVAQTKDEREARMSMSLLAAAVGRRLELQTPQCVSATTPIGEALEKLGPLPLLVIGSNEEELVGIVTAFDLL